MEYLYVEYDESQEGGELAYPENDSWSRTDIYKTVEFKKIHRVDNKNIICDSVEVEKELINKSELYLAVIRYNSGSTFGKIMGCWYIIGFSESYNGAEKLIKDALAGDEYKPWEGYFESFSDEEIHMLKVV